VDICKNVHTYIHTHSPLLIANSQHLSPVFPISSSFPLCAVSILAPALSAHTSSLRLYIERYNMAEVPPTEATNGLGPVTLLFVQFPTFQSIVLPVFWWPSFQEQLSNQRQGPTFLRNIAYSTLRDTASLSQATPLCHTKASQYVQVLDMSIRPLSLYRFRNL
jgi:hypothetical protein